jgi:outer membrane protein assembly factor BamB
MNTFVPCQYGSSGRWQPEVVSFDAPLRPVRLPLPEDDFLFPPLLDGERAFCPSRPHGLVAFALATGEELWRFPTKRGWGACLLHEQQLLVVPRPGVLVVLDPASGAQLDSQPVGELTLDYSVLAGGRIISPLSKGMLGAWDLASRSFAWQVPSGWNLSLIAASDRIVCVAEEHGFVALNLKTGTELWRFEVTELGRYKTILQGEQPGAPAGHPILSPSLAFLGVTGGWLVALEVATGAPRWKLKVDGLFPRNFSLSPDGTLYLLSDDSLTTIEAAKGTLRSRTRILGQQKLNGDGPFASMAISERYIWTVDAMGNLIAISRADQQIAFRQNLRRRVAYPPVIGADRLLIVDSDGRLSIFGSNI